MLLSLYHLIFYNRLKNNKAFILKISQKISKRANKTPLLCASFTGSSRSQQRPFFHPASRLVPAQRGVAGFSAQRKAGLLQPVTSELLMALKGECTGLEGPEAVCVLPNWAYVCDKNRARGETGLG